jgi:hypothetical protein
MVTALELKPEDVPETGLVFVIGEGWELARRKSRTDVAAGIVQAWQAQWTRSGIRPDEIRVLAFPNEERWSQVADIGNAVRPMAHREVGDESFPPVHMRVQRQVRDRGQEVRRALQTGGNLEDVPPRAIVIDGYLNFTPGMKLAVPAPLSSPEKMRDSRLLIVLCIQWVEHVTRLLRHARLVVLSETRAADAGWEGALGTASKVRFAPSQGAEDGAAE